MFLFKTRVCVPKTLLTLSPQFPSCAGLQQSHKLIPASERRLKVCVCVCVFVCIPHIYHLCYQHTTNIYPDLIIIHLLMPQHRRGLIVYRPKQTCGAEQKNAYGRNMKRSPVAF